MMNENELKEYLDFKVKQYNTAEFISSDPIQIPHRYLHKEDIEIMGFLVATIAWGNRAGIIRSGERLMNLMGESPHDFIMNYSENRDLSFVHRTFNAIDLDFFFRSLKNIYHKGGLEGSFRENKDIRGIKGRISNFRKEFLATQHDNRSEKHISDPLKNSAAKRINMFLRWMVRKDEQGVDFGLWEAIPSSELYLPLDVHTGKNARSLGLLKRKQDDWKALDELMINLRKFDPQDPVKYDYALFGIGAFEK